jgi:uncharacterized membrane protein YbhN (UPF0104 family)
MNGSARDRSEAQSSEAQSAEEQSSEAQSAEAQSSEAAVSEPAEEPLTDESPAFDGRRLALGVLGALAATAIVVLSFGRVAGFAELRRTLDSASWGWLTLCVAGQLAVFAGYAGVLRTALAFEDGPEVGVVFSLRVAFAGFGLTQLIAAGGAAGLAFVYWILRRLGIPRRDAAIRLIAMNTAVYLTFALLGWTAAAIALVDPAVPFAMSIPWLISVPLVILAALWFTQPERSTRWTRAGGNWLRQGLAIGVSAAAWVRRATRTREGRLVLSWSAVYWAGDIVSLWAAIRAFGVSTPVWAIVSAYATGYIAQAIPIPLIATGGVDAATTLTLTAVGVPLQVALLGVVAHRVFAFWLPITAGLWAAITLVRRAPQPSPPATTRPVWRKRST